MNKYVKNEIKKSFAFILGGIIIGVLGYFQDGKDQKSLYALCLAFTIIGIAQIAIYLSVRNKPEYVDKIKAEKEERSVFIRDKAGKSAFWITFGTIAISSNLSQFTKLTVADYGNIILIFMCIVYFSFFFYNLKKY